MAIGAEPRAAWGIGRWSPQWARVLKALIAAAVLGAFLYYVSLNLRKHLERKTVFISSEKTSPPFPLYRLCLWPAWHPRRLLSLGLNASGLDQTIVEENYYALSGIDRKISGRRLVETAAWRAGDLLQEVFVGNIHEIYDSATPFPSSLWSHSFTPLGPCLTLTPPPAASQSSQNITIKFRERVADLDPCYWMEEGRSLHYDSLEACSAIQHHCNTSCGWQHFLKDFKVILFHHLLSTSETFWVNGIMNEVRLPDVHFGGNVVVESFKVKTLQDNHKNVDKCFYKCFMADGVNISNCTALMEESLGEPLGSLCVTTNQQLNAAYNFVTRIPSYYQCLYYCRYNNITLRWKYFLDDKTHVDENVFTVQLAKPLTLILTETEMYPLNQFLADTGGGLGLFLGVCALDGWNFLVQIMTARAVAEKRSKTSKLRHLAQLAGTVLALGLTCVHLLIIMRSIMRQPVILAARQTFAANEGNTPASSITSESLLVERMGSRILGCQVPSTAKLDECINCLLQGEQGQSLPFISVRDLPRCVPQHLNFPRRKYIVHKDYVERIASKEFLCPSCAHLNDSRPSNLVKYVVDEDTPGSCISILCALGGLMGLYLGFSLLNVADLFKKSCMRQHLKTGGHCLLAASLAFTGGVVAAAVALCLLLLHTFLGVHPVYSTSSTHGLEEGIMPSVTTCVWPPINIQRLLETAGLGAAFADVAHMHDPEERHAAISLLLQKLPQSSNFTDPRVLWAASAWKQREIGGTLRTVRGIQSFKSPKYSTTSSVLNRCWKYTPNESMSTSVENIEYRFDVHASPVTLDLHYYFLAFLHYPNESILIEPKILSKKYDENIKVSAMTRWKALADKGSLHRGECISRCLDSFLMDHLGCRLPSAVGIRDLPSCSLTQFTSFLTALWRLGTRPQNIYQNLIGPNQTSWCHTACSHKTQTFFMFKHWTIRDREISKPRKTVTSDLSVGVHTQKMRDFRITFRFMTGLLEHMSAYDGYSAIQLLSDLGSVIGMTLGVSLLSVLLTLVSRMSQSSGTLTKVSSFPLVQ